MFRKRQKPLGPPQLWVAVQPVEPVGGIARLFFKETLDLPDMLDLQRFCNRLAYVPETRAM